MIGRNAPIAKYPTGATMSQCIFCQICAGEIPSKKIYEDELFFAFHDIDPIAPTHFLVVPKQHVASLLELTASDADFLGRLLLLAKTLAMQNGLEAGFRTIINTGSNGGQEVMHLHCHIAG